MSDTEKLGKEMMRDHNEAHRMEIYSKYRYKFLVDPYGFAIMNEDLWDDPEALDQAARRWQIRHFNERLRELETTMNTIQEEIKITKETIERIEEYGLG